MVEIASSGSGEGPQGESSGGYSTARSKASCPKSCGPKRPVWRMMATMRGSASAATALLMPSRSAAAISCRRRSQHVNSV